MNSFLDYKILKGKNHVFRMLGYCVFCSHVSDNRGWFRLFEYGVAWKHISLPLLFSERIGISKFFAVGGYRVSFLGRPSCLDLRSHTHSRVATTKDIQEVTDAMDKQNKKSGPNKMECLDCETTYRNGIKDCPECGKILASIN